MIDVVERLRIEARREKHEPIWRDAIAEIERTRSALKVIHTWASVDGALDPEHVKKLCKKTLSA